MRLLVLNPNISDSVTALIRDEARRSASGDAELTVLTAPFGVAYIETRFEALIGPYAAAQMAAEQAAGHDAVIVAAFGDPGLSGLREALDVPVLGMTESVLMSACMLGQRFSIIAISQRICAWYRECVEHLHLATRLASIRALSQPLRNVDTIQDEHRQALLDLCRAAVRLDGADVVVLAGAPLAGLTRSVAGELPVPVVDGVSSATRHAESLVRLQPGIAREGSFARPPYKPQYGLSPALARLLGHGDLGDETTR